MKARLLLTPKDRRTLTPAAQVQKLVRIARRAVKHAEWMRELIATDQHRVNNREAYDAVERARMRDDIARRTVEAEVADLKASHAMEQALAIAESSDDLDLRRKAKMARAAL